MKKITFLIISLFLFIYINACSGYKPIFSSSNFEFKIADYSINGNKKLGNNLKDSYKKHVTKFMIDMIKLVRKMK